MFQANLAVLQCLMQDNLVIKVDGLSISKSIACFRLARRDGLFL